MQRAEDCYWTAIWEVSVLLFVPFEIASREVGAYQDLIAGAPLFVPATQRQVAGGRWPKMCRQDRQQIQ